MKQELESLLEIPPFLDTPHGRVFLKAFPKENHRLVVQETLSSAAGFDVGIIQQTNETERPFFSHCPFDANWTHTKNFCVLAYSEKAKVGIDAEFIRPKSLRLAERFFHLEEINYLKDLEQKNQRQTTIEFFKLWCRKEAYFKCLGGSFFSGTLRKSMLSKEQENVSFSEFMVEHSLGPICIVLATSSR